MPNIELHGYGDLAGVMRQKIVTLLKGSSDPDELVTTVFPTDVEDLDGRKMPYLRLITGPEDIEELVRLLTSLNEDVEVILLAKWLPKQKKV